MWSLPFSRSRLLIVLLFCASRAGAISQEMADRLIIKENREVLLEVQSASGCEFGYVFSVSSGALKGEQKNWTLAILRYLYNNEMNGNDPWGGDEVVADKIVSQRQIERLFSKEPARAWAGAELIAGVDEVARTRGRLLKARAKHEKDSEKNLCEAYERSKEKVVGVLHRRVGVRQEDNGVDCN